MLQAGFAEGIIWGDEMIAAMDEAARIGAPIFFIDQPAAAKSISSKSIPWSEQAIGMVLRGFGSITDVPRPADISAQLSQMKRYQPVTYRIRVAGRDRHMFEALQQICSGEIPESSSSGRTGCVLAFVGAMHVDGIRALWASQPHTRE